MDRLTYPRPSEDLLANVVDGLAAVHARLRLAMGDEPYISVSATWHADSGHLTTVSYSTVEGEDPDDDEDR